MLKIMDLINLISTFANESYEAELIYFVSSYTEYMLKSLLCLEKEYKLDVLEYKLS